MPSVQICPQTPYNEMLIMSGVMETVKLHTVCNIQYCIKCGNTVFNPLARFVFMIGTSVVLAFSSMHKKGVPRLQLLRKLSWRTIVLILIGFCFINYSPRDGLCEYCTNNFDSKISNKKSHQNCSLLLGTNMNVLADDTKIMSSKCPFTNEVS